jgi:hypothetical protein
MPAYDSQSVPNAGEFTPGPWFAGVLTGEEPEGQVISIGPFSFKGRPNRDHHYEDTICEVWDNPNLAEGAEANAALIAAAPDMFKALVEAKNLLRHGEFVSPSYRELVFGFVNEAIVKATTTAALDRLSALPPHE